MEASYLKHYCGIFGCILVDQSGDGKSSSPANSFNGHTVSNSPSCCSIDEMGAVISSNGSVGKATNGSDNLVRMVYEGLGSLQHRFEFGAK